jgi:ZIP family zinc transporter
MEQWPLWLIGSLGSLAAGLATGVGALPILVRAQWSEAARAMMLALAAGVMLGATVFSLLLPSIEIVQAAGGSEAGAVLLASCGLLLGALAIWALNLLVPHEHFVKGREGIDSAALGRTWLFVIAITLHNFPEGMSVGVAYGAGLPTGLAVTAGIALQNLPEGLAVAAALMVTGASRGRAFGIALLTGLIEPVGGTIGAVAVSVAQSLLPWALAFAAGAMLFVISGEVIPETHRAGLEKRATFSLVVGFVVMMMLDVLLA